MDFVPRDYPAGPRESLEARRAIGRADIDRSQAMTEMVLRNTDDWKRFYQEWRDSFDQQRVDFAGSE